MDTSQLKAFQKKLKALQDKELDEFYRRCARRLTYTLLSLVIPKTPVGKSLYGKVDAADGLEREQVVRNGGTLRRGWTSKTEQEASGGNGEPSLSDIAAWAESLTVIKKGSGYSIEVTNPVSYAAYVEYGHRGVYVPSLGKTLHTDKRWTPGKFMLNISEEELINISPLILEEELNKILEGVFDGK